MMLVAATATLQLPLPLHAVLIKYARRSRSPLEWPVFSPVLLTLFFLAPAPLLTTDDLSLSC